MPQTPHFRIKYGPKKLFCVTYVADNLEIKLGKPFKERDDALLALEKLREDIIHAPVSDICIDRRKKTKNQMKNFNYDGSKTIIFLRGFPKAKPSRFTFEFVCGKPIQQSIPVYHYKQGAMHAIGSVKRGAAKAEIIDLTRNEQAAGFNDFGAFS